MPGDTPYGIEDLLIVAQVETPARPAPAGLPGARRPYRSAVQSRSIGPNRALHSPAVGRLQGGTLVVYGITPGESSALLLGPCFGRGRNKQKMDS